MLIVGITGGIGSGKTVFSQELVRLGAYLIEADKVAKELVDEKYDIRMAIGKKFGNEIFNEHGMLKRRELGQIVFSDPKKLEALNRIMQEPLIEMIKKKVSSFRKREDSVAVIDMAILYEAGLDSLCDIIVVINAPLKKRMEWLFNARGWSREEIYDRIKVQKINQGKIKNIDEVINNSGELEDLQKKARDFYQKIVTI